MDRRRRRRLRALVMPIAFALLVATATPALAVVALPPPSMPLPTSGSFLYLNSEPGNYVGHGIEQLFTPANASLMGWLARGADTFRGDTHNATHVWTIL